MDAEQGWQQHRWPQGMNTMTDCSFRHALHIRSSCSSRVRAWSKACVVEKASVKQAARTQQRQKQQTVLSLFLHFQDFLFKLRSIPENHTFI